MSRWNPGDNIVLREVWQQITSNSAADATRWVQYSHYSLLATVEAIFNLGTLGRNDTSATPMSDLFRAESLRISLSSKVSTCRNG